MKKLMVSLRRKIIGGVFSTVFASGNILGTTPYLAVSDIESSGLVLESRAIGNLVRLELEKTGQFQVANYHDMDELAKKSDLKVADCYSRDCLQKLGKALKVDKLVSGSAARFGEKIIVTLRMYDIATGDVTKSSVMEYINLQNELQKMVTISVNDLVDIENDKDMVDLLIYYDQIVDNPRTRLKLNGPRFGATYITGDRAKILQQPRSKGGYDILPYMSQIGYQFEWQYISAGDFQALFEFIPSVAGLGQNIFIPSTTFLSGFRLNSSGWEFAFGPSLMISRQADGFFDTKGVIGSAGDWQREEDWKAYIRENDLEGTEHGYDVITRTDSRGIAHLTSSWIWAVGKTFKSGYLNIPVNVYVSPRKEGWIIGSSVGFNIIKQNQ